MLSAALSFPAAGEKLLCRRMAAQMTDMLRPAKYCMFTQCFTGSIPMPIEFQSPTLSELREMWAQHTDWNVRRLILEIQHLRVFLLEARDLIKVIDQCWAAETDSRLVAILRLMALIENEPKRFGKVTDRPRPKLSPAEEQKRLETLRGRLEADFGERSRNQTLDLR
jgi:hypothetical protein